MFYYKNWNYFCKELRKSGLTLCTAEESLQIKKGERFVVLKHDVETSVPKAHRLAAIEHINGICGSYYVQAYLLNDAENIRLLQEMRDWGHEVSYHYDVLDACSGDFQEAERQFLKYLKLFTDNGFSFDTICQHGNPVKKRVGYTSNRDFFRNKEIHSKYPNLVDMVVDYSLHVKQKYRYISDAGYRWNIITEPETNDLHPDVKNQKVGGFKNLLRMINTTDYSYVVSTHPHRWMSSAWKINLKIVIFRVVKSTVRVIRHIPGFEWLMNKFYYLAKKI